MSKNTESKKSATVDADCCGGTPNSCSFEGNFISIGGGRLEVESDHDKKVSYALATDALLTCDGKVSKEAGLKVGRRIRVTTQKGNANTVTGVEWLNKNKSFPALKAIAK